MDWKFPPDSDLYLKYKGVYDNSRFFNQLTRDVIYPGMNGDVNLDGFNNGIYKIESLQPGEIIDRYGPEGGNFLSPDGTSYRERALPPYTESQPYRRYKVLVPFNVKSGSIAPWFNQQGEGIQYLTDYTVVELTKMGWIEGNLALFFSLPLQILIEFVHHK